MNKKITTALAALALLVGLAGTLTTSASANVIVVAQGYGPVYTTWQPQWDRWQYDRRHVVLGTVVHFRPYRVAVQRRNGNVLTIDLKPGTVIHPTGATPTAGDRIAVYGYWSNGTFIANGMVLR
ncbi:MAG TPA: hypothetical protein VMD47_11260 [Candidatus Acidoferrales bacterium]|nr:hypothetical protein [Candidatus Acidoferrales bacterium]